MDPIPPQDKPIGEPTRTEPLNILSRRFAFHYTVDKGLPDLLRHGLVSRMEERKRGIKVRLHESRSVPTDVYFTTRINDLYFSDFEREHLPLDEILGDVVGIAIDRPRSISITEDGWFTEENFVEPERWKALVIIDRKAYEKPRERQSAHDKYEFCDPLPEEQIRARVEALRKMCQEVGRDIPIVGVSGTVYWPEAK